MKRRLLWLIPLGFAAVLAAMILALPGFVAASAHRATIEALASSLTGRAVKIDGKLSLAFIPAPELIAGGVHIAGPADETITARSLTLDIALPALLRGRLAASSLTLQSPVIAFPWPLPGGPRAIAPPAWLAALHARMDDGTIAMGQLRFSHVNADIFTAGNGAMTISGTADLWDQALNLGISLTEADPSGTAALDVDAAGSAAAIPLFATHFAGTLDPGGIAAGTVTLRAAMAGNAPPLAGTARLTAGGKALQLSGIDLASGQAHLAGATTLDLPGAFLHLDLTSDDADLAALPLSKLAAATAISGEIKLRLNNSTWAGRQIPQIMAAADFGPAGVLIHQFAATLPATGTLTATGSINAAGLWDGDALLDAPDMPATSAAFGAQTEWPAAWKHVHLRLGLTGGVKSITLHDLAGSLGADNFTGSLVVNNPLAAPLAAGAVNFTTLDLTPFRALIQGWSSPAGLSLSGEITAARAHYGKLPMTRLLLDAALSNQLVVRRLSANLGEGLFDASFEVAPDGGLTAARAMLTMPSSAALTALLPAAWQPPGDLAQAPLSLSIRAEGKPTALATSMVAALGPFTLTAAPVLDLIHQTAAGPLTLRNPDAIAAAASFGLKSSLAWPGAGSLALRASGVFSPAAMGFPDFVLSAGDLTANGRIILKPGNVIDAQINADTLALPPAATGLTIPWPALATAQGRVDLTADRIWRGGSEIFGPTTAHINLNAGNATLAISQAALAGGTLSGMVSTTLSPNAAPALTAKLQIAGVNAAVLNLPVDFAYAIPAGTLAGSAGLTATGYSPAAWEATLSGSASLTATQGSMNGFSLGSLRNTLHTPAKAKKTARIGALRVATTTGASAFANLTIAGHFDHGTFNLDQADLDGPDGSASASGSIDLPDSTIALNLLLSPAVTPPLALNITSLGDWPDPKQIPTLREALAWTQAPEISPGSTPPKTP